MARRRKMDPERKAFISSLLEHYGNITNHNAVS